MELKVFFKHMPTSLSLFAYAEKKVVARLERFDLGIVEAHLTFAIENEENIVTCHANIGHAGAALTVAAHDATSMYAAVDALADKLEARLRRHKDRLRSHRSPVSITDVPLAPTPAPDAIDAVEILAYERSHAQL